jgi:hypothetical protein
LLLQKKFGNVGEIREGPTLANVPFASFRFSFASFVAALIATYGIADADQARFRARLTFLQRGGLFGSEHRPGKGTRLTYTVDQMRRVIFCLELAELGVGPAVQLKIVNEFWESRIRPIFTKAETAVEHSSKDDVILLMTGVALMAGAWAGAVPNINHITLNKLPATIALAMRPLNNDDPLLPRVLAVNLSARLRRFHADLVNVHLKFEQPPIEIIESNRAQTGKHRKRAGSTGRRRARKGK